MFVCLVYGFYVQIIAYLMITSLGAEDLVVIPPR